MKKIVVQASMDHFDEVMSFVSSNCEEYGCNMKIQMKMELACDEIFANIVSYAYKNQKIGNVEIEMDCKDHCVLMTFIDSGIPYNPLEVEDPDTTLSIDKREVGGLGILLIKKSMDACFYEFIDGKNRLTVKKHI